MPNHGGVAYEPRLLSQLRAMNIIYETKEEAALF